MPEVTRRRLLSSAAAGAGGVLASSLLPPALARAAAQGPRRGNLRDIKHVVIHMQENRSFDHYFGTLGGVAGFGDPNALIQTDPNPPFNAVQGKSIFYQVDPTLDYDTPPPNPPEAITPQNPDGYLLPFHLDTKSTSSQAIPSTSHAWYYQHLSLNITVPTTAGQPTTALNNNWLQSHFLSDNNSTYGHFYWYVMGYYERQDIPFHFALAENFTICDHYHCSLLGPTWPNRMYLMTGMIDPEGQYGGPVISNVVPSPVSGEPYTWTTYPERLTKAGISWRIYQEEDDYGTNVLEFFKAYQEANPGSPLYEGALTIYPPDRFEWDAKHDKLPTVSWIVPTSGQSEHPAYLPASGANYLASKLNAVAENRNLWNSTVFIVNYDENDGLFDHVVPPLPPAGTPGEFVEPSGNWGTTPPSPNWPIGGGVRVPAFIISPWTVGGYVASEQFDHTSVLQFLEQVTGVQETNITAWRRETFGDLTSALGFSNGKATTFPPRLPNTIGDFWEAENEVETLPPAMFPGANQTPPVQEKRRHRHSWNQPTRGWDRSHERKALPRTLSRAEENRTTHRADFGESGDGVYLAKIQAVADKPLITGTVYAFVPAIVGGAVGIFNTSTFTLASAVSSGTTNPYGAAATPDGSQVWVTESGTNTVSVIDTSTGKIASTIVVGIYPHGIAITPDGKTAYVANTGPNTGPGGSQTVSVVNVASQTETGTIDVGEGPQIVTISPDGSLAFVTCADGLYVITTANGSVAKVREPLHQPHGVAVTPDGKHVYVTDSERDQVVVLATSGLRTVGRIGVGNTPWNTAFNSGGSSAYVTNSNDNTVSVINTATQRVTQTIGLGSFTYTDTPKGQTMPVTYTQPNQIPTAIALAPPDNRYLWVACNVSGSLAIIDTTTNKVTNTAQAGLGTEPTAIAFAS